MVLRFIHLYILEWDRLISFNLESLQECEMMGLVLGNDKKLIVKLNLVGFFWNDFYFFNNMFNI